MASKGLRLLFKTDFLVYLILHIYYIVDKFERQILASNDTVHIFQIDFAN